MPSQPRRAYLALLVVAGLIGAAALALGLWLVPITQTPAVMLAFCALGGVTRVLAFPLYRGRVIAFDSAYFVAAGVVLGWVPAALIVVVTLTIDLTVQGLRVRLFDVEILPRSERAAQALYATFGNAGLVLLCGVLLDAVGLSPEHINRHTAVFYATPLALLLFVAGHYHIALVAAVLNGDPPGRAYRQLVLNGMLGESLLTPLAMVMVLVYQVSDPAPFVLLAATVLVINAGFFIAARYAQRLNERVRDLTILDAVHRALSRNLELELLLQTLAAQLVRHVPDLGRVLIAVRDVGSGALGVRAFTAEGRPLFEKPVSAREGLLGRVVDQRRPIVLDGRPLKGSGEDPDLLSPDTRAWLGLPLLVHDEVIGVLCLQSPQPSAFRRQHELLLVPLAAQAAIAIENARLFQLATVDGLTGLFVRRYFDQRLEDECHRSQRFGTVFSLLMLDLDDFKFVNDTRGHAAGDRVLRETASLLRRALRSVDIAARYGGEEFVVILPRADLDTARQVAERIRETVASHAITGVTGTLHITLSVGVASYPRDAMDPSQLVKAADRALYQAKGAGKNRVVCAADQPRPTTGELLRVMPAP